MSDQAYVRIAENVDRGFQTAPKVDGFHGLKTLWDPVKGHETFWEPLERFLSEIRS